MKTFFCKTALIFTVAIALLVSGFSQDIADTKKLLKTATKYFINEEFNKALELFLQLDSLTPDDYEINYKIGACYLNSKFENTKAIPYLEKSIKIKGESIIPPVVFKDLGMLYHLGYKFSKAIHSYKIFLKLSEKDAQDISYAKRMIEVCENAKILVSDTLDVRIENIGYPINTGHSEYCPLITADKSIMYFTRNIHKKQDTDIDSVQQIMVSYNELGKWTHPEEIKFDYPDKDEKILLAGISADGGQLFLHIISNIFTCQVIERKCSDLKNLSKMFFLFDSELIEEKLSITPDGRELYLSSNRPGGYGGKDIYRIVKDETDNWSEPVNLGPTVNTIYDEDSPFIHPDKKTLYFSSNGHNTMGGYDIFKTTFSDNIWGQPENIGFPINTTKDDVYFVLSADGRNGYFSSSRNNNFNKPDIFKISFDDNIPLTMLKGTILAGNPLKPVRAKIRVIDKETNTRVKYIYNPNPDGKYLMIFPPAKNYDMIIEAKDYLPQLVNIHIPDQTYFYELFQEIHLKPVSTLDTVVIGEEITVRNTFYDVYKTLTVDTSHTTAAEDTTYTKDYSELLELVDNLVNVSDSLNFNEIDKAADIVIEKTTDEEEIVTSKDYDLLLDIIDKAIETTDSVALDIIDEQTVYDKKSSKTYFYAKEKEENNLQQVIVGEDTVYTVPGIDVDSLAEEILVVSTDTSYIIKTVTEQEEIDFKNTNTKDRKTILTLQVHFETNESTVEDKYFSDIEEITDLLINNYDLGVEIYGYADTEGDTKHNLILSQQRANSILDLFLNNGMNTKKAVLKGFGEMKTFTEKTDEEKSENRRVDINIFELINIDY